MILENTTFDELDPGASFEHRRVCTLDDLYVFAAVSGNHNPMHLPDDSDESELPVASGIWCSSLISAVLGNYLPGPGTLYHSQALNFVGRVHAGDEVLIRVTVKTKHADGTVTLDTEVRDLATDTLVVQGEVVVIAPTRKITFDDAGLPGLVVQRHRHFSALIRKAEPLPPLVTAVICPEETESLEGALLAARRKIITPILVGNRDKILQAAAQLNEHISEFEMVHAEGEAAAAIAGVDLVTAGRAGTIMKGHLHTDILLRAALRKTGGLRRGRRFTHTFVMDVPGVAHPLLVTDAAINIAPDLMTKVDIVQNAIDLAISMGIETPRVGVLSAVELVNPAIVSSMDAALLSKMADRGQIKGGLVEGPLAMDNAVDPVAARSKGIKSMVAGHAEVLVVPDLDAGNMLVKQLTFMAGAEAAGVVLGASVPIILTSRADDAMSRLASCAVAAIHQARLTDDKRGLV
ncbi:bifunctional enoyl-CoA hydratase/phosphate acetyltransferase [Aestuariicella hydrocarbonica]|uniref:Bifunctional enoyl-CoA hydratase/phosphate acetyltransferase n=1 Tax=Pseudomaricurvus hydrocarbonicus TaxID=1470433 RepID=A0A9E5JVK8_9GAMM|nr:bifunctional enoyl-CoA hydratase/phosphate acetyltransferase [Aestuariicella hydrocarbonica]NHO65695.1 bifunctional enoyl-CoA hydratase/phosphate acetyltransferase [Aestuariicella hydrocarbonica]